MENELKQFIKVYLIENQQLKTMLSNIRQEQNQTFIELNLMNLEISNLKKKIIELNGK